MPVCESMLLNLSFSPFESPSSSLFSISPCVAHSGSLNQLVSLTFCLTHSLTSVCLSDTHTHRDTPWHTHTHAHTPPSSSSSNGDDPVLRFSVLGSDPACSQNSYTSVVVCRGAWAHRFLVSSVAALPRHCAGYSECMKATVFRVGSGVGGWGGV